MSGREAAAPSGGGWLACRGPARPGGWGLALARGCARGPQAERKHVGFRAVNGADAVLGVQREDESPHSGRPAGRLCCAEGS